MNETSSELKILWMIPKWTLPATDGARVATDGLVRSTVSAGAQVDVLCLPQESEKVDINLMKRYWGVKNVSVIRRDLPKNSSAKKIYYLKKLLLNPLTPLTFSSFSNKSIRSQVRSIIDMSHYDVILLDGLHLGAAVLGKSEMMDDKKRPKIIYRAHNIEVDLWKKAYKEKKNFFLKPILYYQSKLVEKFEHTIIKNSHGVAAISPEDLVVIKKISDSRCEFVPLGLNFDYPLRPCENENIKFLFIGRLDWPPNRDGLEWILKDVWPKVIKKRPHAILKIVGSGEREWLKKYEFLKGLEIHGFVESIREAYRDCHFTIVPITYGSGTRIKVIESFALGRRPISTQMGVQGAGVTEQDYIRAESTEQWIEVLSTIQLDRIQNEKLEESRGKLARKMGENYVGARFYHWLKTLP